MTHVNDAIGFKWRDVTPLYRPAAHANHAILGDDKLCRKDNMEDLVVLLLSRRLQRFGNPFATADTSTDDFVYNPCTIKLRH